MSFILLLSESPIWFDLQCSPGTGLLPVFQVILSKKRQEPTAELWISNLLGVRVTWRDQDKYMALVHTRSFQLGSGMEAQAVFSGDANALVHLLCFEHQYQGGNIIDAGNRV